MNFFDGHKVAIYVDGTLGAAGHASAVVQRHPELHTVVGFDLDPHAHIIASSRLSSSTNLPLPTIHKLITPTSTPSDTPPSSFHLSPPFQYTITNKEPSAHIIHSNYSSMKTALQNMHLSSSSTTSSRRRSSIFGQVDAMLLDLGISSMQVDEGERGFSLMRDGPLDMRMDPSCSITQSAADLVNNASEAEIGRIIREYGEERWWKVIAKRMVDAREDVGPLMTTGQLVEAIGRLPNSGGGGGGGKGKGQSKKGSSSSSSSSKGGRKGGGNIHPATRTFQALRIAVNNELGSLAQVIPDAIDALAPGGRLAVISFHSLEDRVVKWAFRKAAGMVVPSEEEERIGGGGRGGGRGGYGGVHSHMLMMMEREREMMQDGRERKAVVKILTKRPILPGDDEVRRNPRSRSAKLRVVEKLGGG